MAVIIMFLECYICGNSPSDPNGWSA